MPKYKLVVFDIAGTTVKDPGNVAQAFMDAFATNEIAVGLEDVNPVMGFRKEEAIRIVLEKKNVPATGELVEKIHRSFVQNMILFYEQVPALEALPGVNETFEILRSSGIYIALNTGFSRDITEVILSRLGWKENGTINKVICSDEVPAGRPAPYMIHQVMQQLSIDDPSLVAKVGDTEVDILEGRNAGCGLVVGVTTGSYKRDQFEPFHPDHIIDHMDQLTQLLS